MKYLSRFLKHPEISIYNYKYLLVMESININGGGIYANADGSPLEVSEVTLLDGSVVYCEGTMESGAVLYLWNPEVEFDVVVSVGEWTTEGGAKIVVGENGIIETVSEVTV